MAGAIEEDLQRRPRTRGRLERVRSAHPSGERLLHPKTVQTSTPYIQLKAVNCRI
jgi:hypothetical protein